MPMIPCARTDLVVAETPHRPSVVALVVGFDSETGEPYAIRTEPGARALPASVLYPEGYYVLQAVQVQQAPMPLLGGNGGLPPGFPLKR